MSTEYNCLIEHIQTLHKQANGIDGKLVIASFGEKCQPIIEHFFVGQVQEMIDKAIFLARLDGRNLYSAIAVMRSNLELSSKGCEKDVIAVLGFVADYDNAKGDYETRNPFNASYVFETSPGNSQSFFYLNKPFIIKDDADFKKIKNLSIAFNKSCPEADPVGVDLSHVWRLPDALNCPNSKKIAKGRDPKPFLVKRVG